MAIIHLAHHAVAGQRSFVCMMLLTNVLCLKCIHECLQLIIIIIIVLLDFDLGMKLLDVML